MDVVEGRHHGSVKARYIPLKVALVFLQTFRASESGDAKRLSDVAKEYVVPDDAISAVVPAWARELAGLPPPTPSAPPRPPTSSRRAPPAKKALLRSSTVGVVKGKGKGAAPKAGPGEEREAVRRALELGGVPSGTDSVDKAQDWMAKVSKNKRGGRAGVLAAYIASFAIATCPLCEAKADHPDSSKSLFNGVGVCKVVAGGVTSAMKAAGATDQNTVDAVRKFGRGMLGWV